MKFKFHEVPVFNLDGSLIENSTVYKTLANVLYQFSPDLDLVDIAMRINKAEEVEFTPGQVETIKKLIKDPKTGFLAFAQKAFLDYIAEVEVAAKAATKAQQ